MRLCQHSFLRYMTIIWACYLKQAATHLQGKNSCAWRCFQQTSQQGFNWGFLAGWVGSCLTSMSLQHHSGNPVLEVQTWPIRFCCHLNERTGSRHQPMTYILQCYITTVLLQCVTVPDTGSISDSTFNYLMVLLRKNTKTSWLRSPSLRNTLETRQAHLL